MAEGEKKPVYHFLVNPAAANGRGKKVWHRTEHALLEKSVRYECVFSKSAAHLAEAVSRLAAHDNVRLVVIGGDGTLSQVVNAIADFSRVRLGYIPAGSGNDFARSLDLPKDPAVILDAILEDRIVRRLDVGTLSSLPEEDRAQTDTAAQDNAAQQTEAATRPDDPPAPRRFIVSAGIGFDAAVCEGVDRSRVKRILGRVGLAKLSYLFIALKIVFGLKKSAATLLLNGHDTIDLRSMMFTAMMIQRFEGGGFQFAPEADSSDGRFDLCIAGDISVPKFLFALPKAKKGTHFSVNGVDHAIASFVEIRTDMPQWVHADGEVITRSSHITLGCAQGILQMMH